MIQILKRSYLKELEEYDASYNSCPMIPLADWKNLRFKSMILDEADGHTIVESDHPNGYNMIVLHPVTHQLIWVYSADFDDYEELKEATYKISFKESATPEYKYAILESLMRFHNMNFHFPRVFNITGDISLPCVEINDVDMTATFSKGV